MAPGSIAPRAPARVNVPDRSPGSPAGGGGSPSELEGRLREELAPDLEILRPLGSGRSSRVFLGRDRALARLVAIKALDSQSAQKPTAARRFEREARSIAALTHPNVVDIHRFGRLSDATPYLVMRYVPGRSAAERLTAEGPLPPDEALRILSPVAAALAAAHDEGIVHRDVRPANMLLEEKTGRVVLADFGIAALLPEGDHDVTQLTERGETLGFPEYLSPEQLRGEPVSDRTDIYALGVSAWVLLTGQGPYGERSARELVVAHLKEEPRFLTALRPELDPEIADLLRRCLAKAPEHRPTATHLAARLAGPGGEAERERRPTPILPGRFFARLRRRRLFQILLAYVAGGFAILEGVDQLVSQELLPGVVYRLALVTALAGLPTVAILGWYHGEKGAQRVRPLEVSLLLAVGAGWLAAMLWVLMA